MFPFIHMYTYIHNMVPKSGTLIPEKLLLIYCKRSSCKFIVPRYVPNTEILTNWKT